MKNAARASLRPALLIAGACFLFNPNINILDVLPDCFGWLLFAAALGKLPGFIDYFADAKKRFFYLAILSGSRLVAYPVMIGLTHNSNELRINVTLFALVYGILELILLLPALKSLFEGLDFLGERYGAPSVCGETAGQAKSAAYALMIAKPILAFLPELAYLSNPNLGYVTNAPDPTDYHGYFVVIAAGVGLIFGLVFLAFWLRFARAISADPVIEGLVSEDTAATLPEQARARRVLPALTLLAAAIFFMIDVQIDRIQYLPDAIGGLLFLVAAFLLYSCYRKEAALLLAAGGLYTACSVTAYLFNYQFYAHHSFEALGRVPAADRLYTALTWMSGAESVTLLFVCVALVLLLFRVIDRDTGFIADDARPHPAVARMRRELKRKTLFFAGIGGLTAVASFLDVCLKRITVTVDLGTVLDDGYLVRSDETAVLPAIGWLWLVVLALSILWFCYAWYLTAAISGEIRQKYEVGA